MLAVDEDLLCSFQILQGRGATKAASTGKAEAKKQAAQAPAPEHQEGKKDESESAVKRTKLVH